MKVTVTVPLSKAMRNSRLRCSSFMNSSFCRKRAMRSSSRYCFSFLSCSVAPAVRPETSLGPEAPGWDPDGAVHCPTDDTEDEEDEDGWDKLLWELCEWDDDRKSVIYLFYFESEAKADLERERNHKKKQRERHKCVNDPFWQCFYLEVIFVLYYYTLILNNQLCQHYIVLTCMVFSCCQCIVQCFKIDELVWITILGKRVSTVFETCRYLLIMNSFQFRDFLKVKSCLVIPADGV